MSRIARAILLRYSLMGRFLVCALTSTGLVTADDICRVLSSLDRLDGTSIRVIGVVDASEEAIWIAPFDCSIKGDQVLRLGKHFLPSIHVGNISSAPVFDLKGRQLSKEQAEAQWIELKKVRDRDSSTVIVGEFEGRLTTSLKEIVFGPGSRRVIGFGHLGAWPAEIDLHLIKGLRVSARRRPNDK